MQCVRNIEIIIIFKTFKVILKWQWCPRRLDYCTIFKYSHMEYMERFSLSRRMQQRRNILHSKLTQSQARPWKMRSTVDVCLLWFLSFYLSPLVYDLMQIMTNRQMDYIFYYEFIKIVDSNYFSTIFLLDLWICSVNVINGELAYTVVVSEKWDVYSFVVPKEILSSLQSASTENGIRLCEISWKIKVY